MPMIIHSDQHIAHLHSPASSDRWSMSFRVVLPTSTDSWNIRISPFCNIAIQQIFRLISGRWSTYCEFFQSRLNKDWADPRRRNEIGTYRLMRCGHLEPPPPGKRSCLTMVETLLALSDHSNTPLPERELYCRGLEDHRAVKQVLLLSSDRASIKNPYVANREESVRPSFSYRYARL